MEGWEGWVSVGSLFPPLSPLQHHHTNNKLTTVESCSLAHAPVRMRAARVGQSSAVTAAWGRAVCVEGEGGKDG